MKGEPAMAVYSTPESLFQHKGEIAIQLGELASRVELRQTQAIIRDIPEDPLVSAERRVLDREEEVDIGPLKKGLRDGLRCICGALLNGVSPDTLEGIALPLQELTALAGKAKAARFTQGLYMPVGDMLAIEHVAQECLKGLNGHNGHQD